jgi:hypothetical protein
MRSEVLVATNTKMAVFGTLHHVVSYILTDVSEELSDSFIRH